MCIPKKEVTDKGVKPKRRVKSEDDGDDDSGKEGKVCEDPSKSAVSKAVSKHGSVIKPAADKKKKVGESARGSKDKGMSFKVSRQDKAATKMSEEWIIRVLNKGVENSVNEFRALAKWKPDAMTTDACMANKEKNRYMDVPCQDEKRIILKHPGLDGDYVHANYLATPKSEKRFICTQGPLEGTQFSFWAMVVQEDVKSIVMLCNTVECGKLKCFQYWPEKKGETMKFGEGEGEITVTTGDCSPLSATETTIHVTKLDVKWKSVEREVLHYQWENWPDRGVPPSAQTALNLIAAVRGNTTPILVHCSAGIGRTGTIVAIAYVQEKMQNGQSCMAMDELLKNIRSQRPFSIQNEMQYLYLHRVVLLYLLEKHKDRFGHLFEDADNKAKYEQWCADYDRVTMLK